MKQHIGSTMTKSLDTTARFDDSFLSHMVRDFFFVLLVVIIVELGLRFFIVWYDFHNESRRATELAANRLATDVKSIMLNSGGPVAARTVYPILKHNYDDLGYSIAIQPSELTLNAIRNVFDFEAKGIAPEWPEGQHHEVRVELEAEQFCISCHIGAKPGDVLGEVIVRKYLATHLSHWWVEVQLTSLFGMGKIILHTVVLFFLLKVRMEPLLSLRAVITLLSKGASDLSHRAAIKSHDEFGELARDLNLFLDRIDHVVMDLGSILTKVVALNQRLSQVQTQMFNEYRQVESQLKTTTKHFFDSHNITPRNPTPWLNAMTLALASLRSLADEKGLPASLQKRLERCVIDLDTVVEAPGKESQPNGTGQQLLELSQRFHNFSHFISEMAVLDEKMGEIAEEGRILLDRLRSMETERDIQPA